MITLNDYLYSGDTVLRILQKYIADLKVEADRNRNEIDRVHCDFLAQIEGMLEHNEFLTAQSQKIRDFYKYMAKEYPYLSFTFKGRIKSLIRAESKFNGYIVEYIYDYYKLKKDILNLNDIHLYDVYVPIGNILDKKYSYEEAKEVILKVLEVFEDEYITKVKEALDNRWIDVYPTKNKRTGGYSGGSYDTYPYILLNYQDKYNDMSTLIHEMGHSMHSYYSRNYNDYQNSEYRIFVAEVASTVNELLLSHYMLEHSNSKEERLFILNNLMELYRATIYRQTMFAEFEKEISNVIDNDGALTADKLSNMYYDLNKFYFGDNVVVDDYIRYEWERIPHFYYDFYVYKYATGLSAATVIVNNILSGKEEAVDGYIEFLKCGSRKSPIESLKLAGVDLTKKEVVTSALDEFKNILDMYKKETN